MKPGTIISGCLAPLLTWFFLTTPSAADSGIEVDISKGVVDGQAAISFWAVKGIGSRDLVDPSGFVVRLVPSTDLDTVLTRPVGEWLLLPRGKYKFWLEGPGWITPYSSIVNYSPKPFKGKGVAGVVPVVPAGTVVLAAGVTTSRNTIMRLLHLDSHNQTLFPQREFSRTARGQEMSQGTLMPEGRVVAALVEGESKEYIALSPPVDVNRNSIASIWPEKPKDTQTDLLVRLERPTLVSKHEEYDIEFFVRNQEGSVMRPGVVVPTADRIYAIWYGLYEKRVILEVASPSVFLNPTDIVLRPGKVESYRGSLRPLPEVEVRIDLPPAFESSQDLRLEVVRERPGRKSLHEVTLPPGTRSYTLKSVPAEPIDVALHAPPWVFHKPIDLSDGRDALIYFEPTPITLRGTVYRGGRGHRAVIEFQTNRKGDTLRIETDDMGAYEATLFRAGHYLVSVFLDGAGPRYVELLDRAIREDTTLDFRIPDNRFRVRVVDATTNEGISGAEIMVGNKFLSAGGPLRIAGQEKTATLRVVTDAKGVAEMQPLNPGELTLRAQAEGYLPSETLESYVAEDEREREFEIALQRIKESVQIQMLLHNGQLAAHAGVRLQASLANVMPLWSGTTDEQGIVGLPYQVAEAWVLVRHHAAGFLIRRMPRSTLAEPLTWTLAAPAAPLSVVVKRPWGDPAKWAQFALWTESGYIMGQTLTWLTGANPAADQEGFWQARNLPASPLKILAWSPGEVSDPLGLEALAVGVSYPWQEIVELETFN